jgi:hypothetical protein
VPDLRAAEIKRLLQAQCPGLLFELVPGLKREGKIFCGPNPGRAGDSASSFKVKPDGRFIEFDDSEAPDGRGDILNLIALAGGHAPKSTEGRAYAFDWAKRRLGLAGADRATIARAKQKASFVRKQNEDSERRRAEFLHRKMLAIRAKSKPIVPGDAVHTYLKARLGIDLFAIGNRCPSLRCHDDLEHWAMPEGHSWRGPAMVALAVNRDGYVCGIHCTFIDLANAQNKFKAPVANPKLMLGDIKGSIVPLTYGPSGLATWEAVEKGVSEPVILCEGNETGVAEAVGCMDEHWIAGARVWACLSLSNIGNAPVDLKCVSAIFVSTENDLKPQALRQRDEAVAKLETHGKPLVLKRVHEGSDAAELLEG